MATTDLWSEAPKNRYAAERSARATSSADHLDAHTGRRRVTTLLAGAFLIVNLALLSTVIPSVSSTVKSVMTLPDLSAPSQ